MIYGSAECKQISVSLKHEALDPVCPGAAEQKQHVLLCRIHLELFLHNRCQAVDSAAKIRSVAVNDDRYWLFIVYPRFYGFKRAVGDGTIIGAIPHSFIC